MPLHAKAIEKLVKIVGRRRFFGELNWTEFAILFDDGDKEFWIPKSAMEDWPNKYDTGVALVKRWFAEKKGLC